uniref:Sialin n=1 Tax=Tetraodon nigroviridis TaxID=99883 RepID=H3CJL1_TETNG
IYTRRSDESEETDCLIEKNAAQFSDLVCFPGTVLRGCCPARVQLAVLMFFGFAVVYALRVNFSVAMVAMVNASDTKQVLNHSVVRACPLPSGKDNSSDPFLNPEGTPQYLWDPETQGWLLGAFFFGYLCTQIPGGYLSDHYGGSIFLGVGVLSTAVLTLLTPLAAQLGPTWLFALRAVEGFGEGTTFPAMMSMWTRWPPLERSRLMTFSGAGCTLGILGPALTGYICQTLGWPAVFYICGGVGCIWAVFWFTLVSDDPRTHRWISQEEREYIVNSIGPQVCHSWSVPLLPMALSLPLWALTISQMCSNWSYYTLLTSLPTYMDNILHFDLKSNSFLSALPFLGAWLFSILSGVIADLLIEKDIFSVTIVRKLFTLIGVLPPAAFLVAVSYVGCDHILAVTFLTLSNSVGGASAAGIYMNQIDIAPPFAGFLLGITNTFGTIPGVVAPIVTGYFTEDHTLAGWRNVFWVAALINTVGVVIYTIFGSGKIQPWALTEEKREEDE